MSVAISKRKLREFLGWQHAWHGPKLGHIFTLWEIPGENEKDFLVEHIAAYASDEKASVIGVFHKIRDRVLEVAPETSLTALMDDQALECILDVKSCLYVNRNCFSEWRRDAPPKSKPWLFSIGTLKVWTHLIKAPLQMPSSSNFLHVFKKPPTACWTRPHQEKTVKKALIRATQINSWIERCNYNFWKSCQPARLCRAKPKPPQTLTIKTWKKFAERAISLCQ